MRRYSARRWISAPQRRLRRIDATFADPADASGSDPLVSFVLMWYLGKKLIRHASSWTGHRGAIAASFAVAAAPEFRAATHEGDS